MATALASLVASDMYEAVKVLTQVKTLGRLPWGNRNNRHAGRLPSDLHRPMGSSVDGTFTATSNLCMMALIGACLEKRPWLLMQLFCKSGHTYKWLPQFSPHHCEDMHRFCRCNTFQRSFYLPTYPITTCMNLLGECNIVKIHSICIVSVSLFFFADFDNRC